MKYRHYFKAIVYLAVAAAFVLLAAAFVPGLPGWLPQTDLVLVFLLFVLALSGLKPALLFALLIGYLSDSLSFLPFGLHAFSLLIAVLASFFLLTSFLTNRSLYSFLALTVFATIVLWLSERLVDLVLSSLAGQDSHLLWLGGGLVSLLAKLVLNSVLVVVSFQLVNFLTHKLKPVFLAR